MTCTGMSRALALSCRSVCVVALHCRFVKTLMLVGPAVQASTQRTRRSPKGVTDHQESDINSVCSAENIISMLQCTKPRLWRARP